jgi:5,10-methylenetetrahydromethanopterin reductase
VSDNDPRARPLPRLGVRLHGGLSPARCVELARATEAAGLAAVWFAENPFSRGVLPAAAACAVATERVRIGIGVFNPFNRHPTLIAMEIGALDELAGGRAALGVGSGIGTAVERMGLKYDRPLGAVADTVAIVRAMLRGETADYSGRVFSAHGAALGYTPPRPTMPIFMAARGDRSLALCGRIADGLMISNMCTPAFSARARDIVTEAARVAGRPPPGEIVQYVPCVARPDRAEAYEAAKEMLGDIVTGFWSLGGRFPAARAAMLQGSGIDAPEFETAVERLAAGVPAAAALDDRYVVAFAIAGTAEDCLARSAVHGESGVGELVLTFAGAGAPGEIAYLGAAAARLAAAR